jgi:hypothetical protein
MSPKRAEVKMTISLPQDIYEAMLEVATKNKFDNIKKGVKGEGKKPSTLTELVRIACEEKYVK